MDVATAVDKAPGPESMEAPAGARVADADAASAPSLLSTRGCGRAPGIRQHFHVHHSAMANPAAAPIELAFLFRNTNPSK